MSSLTVCIVCDSQREALARTRQSLPAKCTLRYVACADRLPDAETLSELEAESGLPVVEIPWNDRLDQFYTALSAQISGPFLLLEAGETIDAAGWAAVHQALQTAEAPVMACTLRRREQIEVSPRLFLKQAAVPAGSVICLATADTPRISGLEIQATEAGLFYRQPDEQRLWLARLSETEECFDAHFLRGLTAFQAHRDSEALSAFQGLTDASVPAPWRRLGQIMYLKALWETGQQSQALAQLDHFRQQDAQLEQNPSLWVLRGVMARQLRQADLALDCFYQALELASRPDFYTLNPLVLLPDITWKPLLGMGEIELAESLFSQAYLHFQQALEYLPEHDYVLSGLAKAAFFTRQYDTLRGILNPPTGHVSELRGISENGQQLLRYFLTLQAEHAMPETYAAIEALFRDGLKLGQDAFLVSVLVELAILLLHQRQHRLARKLFQLLVSLVPDQPLLGHNLAYSYFAEGDYAQAEQHYRAVLQQAPQFIESRFDLAKTLVMQHRIAEAVQELNTLLQHQPQFAQARQALRELEARELEAVMMPLPEAAGPPAPAEMPFVFVFPLEASWENGLDIALKAFYQEFLPEENVVLALPAESEPELLKEARAWALQQHDEDLLPPVALLSEPLPLLAGRSAWLLPWRVNPGSSLIEALSQSAYPALLTEMPLEQPAGQFLPARVHAEASGSSRRVWKETDIAALQAQLRQAYNGALQPAEAETAAELHTHSFVGQRQLSQPAAAQLAETDLQSAAAPKALRISVCMIVRDEAATLARCLDSIHDAVDEIIVVDTGSVDQSREIADNYAKVRRFEHPWRDDFAAARNFALAQASGEWILSLDGDEYVGPAFMPTLRYLLSLPQQPDSYAFPVLAINEQGAEDPEYSLGSVPRVFPNDPAYRYRGRIHEMVYHADKPTLRYFLLRQLPIYHTGYQLQVRAAKDKRSRDMALMQRLIAEAPEAPETGRIYFILGLMYEKSGQLDAALQTFSAGLQAVTDDPLVRDLLETGRFRVWLQQGQAAEILNHREAAAESVQRRVLLAQALLLQGAQAEEAFAEAEAALLLAESQALQPDPLNLQLPREQILSFLARAAEQMGQSDDALYFLRRCLKASRDRVYLQRYQRLQQALAAGV
ncbi:MAG: glycosyltransferase [Candidatus Sericytochromatia bacterium]|nr:glycosyltransferase [Candidatus Sericytochromatia bacterium]